LSQEITSSGNLEKLNLPSVVETLMLCHRGKWLRFVQRMVQNESDAEDVLQEAVLRMLLRDRQFCSAEQARMYLGRIICNTAIELYHSRRRHRRRYRPLEEQLVAGPECAPEQSMGETEAAHIRARMLDLLGQGLASLPVKQYEALRLTIMNPGTVSLRDAGVEHNIPYSTLRHRCVQGLRRLRRYLLREMRNGPARARPS
jgi:RNA polymerase sigma factor (sigma-70 family)